jgi:hypothetical protein
MLRIRKNTMECIRLKLAMLVLVIVVLVTAIPFMAAFLMVHSCNVDRTDDVVQHALTSA